MGETHSTLKSAERAISIVDRGVVRLGTSLALLEFDPQQATALALQDGRGTGTELQNRRRLFSQLVLKFRKELEVGAISHGFVPSETGPLKALTTFLGELHDNAYEHGRRLAVGDFCSKKLTHFAYSKACRQ